MLSMAHCSLFRINAPSNPSAVTISAILIRSRLMPFVGMALIKTLQNRADNNLNKWNEQRGV